ncbi:lipid carrier--UDP-N-acetylgalactosaminyltransferase [Pedobacter sp. HMWF019]|uniref:sugar transferase n=1 Tax=Pedobacter sp. HMWF019 TaxID=2056856 RepID=UPI000D39AF51|nr:sugar transferase [Pedobacter sp. HMWF019]PTT04036.1 lipid carrier--UDP-N-acetylgalactosaminyltransferase [Pedobacter sp. HMWF019]
MYRFCFKRVFDFISGLFLLLLVSPIFLITFLILKLDYKGDVFFKQKRPGYKERPFYILKFKTMRDTKDASGVLLPDNQRVTTIGQKIRKWSVDEIPQLINVIKGDMSLVGPRPLLFKYIPLYTEQQRRRHNVRPGMTGLAQIGGRNSISWERKFELDCEYTERLSLWLDVKILCLTFFKVIRREGINQSVERPMQPFTGTN